MYYADTVKISRSDMTAFLTANSSYKMKSALADCKAKALVLAGSKEQAIMKRSARKIAERMPTAELEIIKGFYHGDLSINHASLYAEKLLRLTGR